MSTNSKRHFKNPIFECKSANYELAELDLSEDEIMKKTVFSHLKESFRKRKSSLNNKRDKNIGSLTPENIYYQKRGIDSSILPEFYEPNNQEQIRVYKVEKEIIFSKFKENKNNREMKKLLLSKYMHIREKGKLIVLTRSFYCIRKLFREKSRLYFLRRFVPCS